MWNSLETHVKVAERACATATPSWSDEVSGEGLQWCTIKFDRTSHSVECIITIEKFMDNATVATALGVSLKHPLRIEMVPNKFQVEAKCWDGELDVFVSQARFRDEYNYHGHMQEEICGPCYVIPRIVKDYFRLHFAALNGDTSEGSFFTGLLQTLVRRLMQLNAGGHCCVCGLLTSPRSVPGQILWPCVESLICQATYETWRNVTAEDIQSYARQTVSPENNPSYEAWQRMPSVKRGSEKHGFETYGFEKPGSKKDGVKNASNRVFRIERHSYNRRCGWLRKIFGCLRCRFCVSYGRAVNYVRPD